MRPQTLAALQARAERDVAKGRAVRHQQASPGGGARSPASYGHCTAARRGASGWYGPFGCDACAAIRRHRAAGPVRAGARAAHPAAALPPGGLGEGRGRSGRGECRPCPAAVAPLACGSSSGRRHSPPSPPAHTAHRRTPGVPQPCWRASITLPSHDPLLGFSQAANGLPRPATHALLKRKQPDVAEGCGLSVATRTAPYPAPTPAHRRRGHAAYAPYPPRHR
jgi:hypothetical protein